MFDRNSTAPVKVILALSVLFLAADQALAYVGPGADVTFIGQFLALVWLVVAACSSILLWPIYALLRKIRGPKKQQSPQEDRASNLSDP